MLRKKFVNSKAGFTLLEILLVVGIISILAGIVILAINPTKQLGDTRNAQRRSDVLTILNAIYQYSIDPGQTVADLGLTSNDACNASATDAIDLDGTLVPTYVTAIPVDPVDGTVESVSAYYVDLHSTTGRITVCAPSAENSITIEVTR